MMIAHTSGFCHCKLYLTFLSRAPLPPRPQRRSLLLYGKGLVDPLSSRWIGNPATFMTGLGGLPGTLKTLVNKPYQHHEPFQATPKTLHPKITSHKASPKVLACRRILAPGIRAMDLNPRASPPPATQALRSSLTCDPLVEIAMDTQLMPRPLNFEYKAKSARWCLRPGEVVFDVR